MDLLRTERRSGVAGRQCEVEAAAFEPRPGGEIGVNVLVYLVVELHRVGRGAERRRLILETVRIGWASVGTGAARAVNVAVAARMERIVVGAFIVPGVAE